MIKASSRKEWPLVQENRHRQRKLAGNKSQISGRFCLLDPIQVPGSRTDHFIDNVYSRLSPARQSEPACRLIFQLTIINIDRSCLMLRQTVWRRRRATRIVRFLLATVISKVFDESTGAYYYFNTLTGDTSWSKPALFGSEVQFIPPYVYVFDRRPQHVLLQISCVGPMSNEVNRTTDINSICLSGIEQGLLLADHLATLCVSK